jgi:N-glycosylase/DNA lyase
MMTSEHIISVGEFDLTQTLESGQCFRWRRISNHESWGIVNGGALHVKQDGDRLCVRHCGGRTPINLADDVADYFDLSFNYRTTLRRLRRDHTFARVAPRRATLHILRQCPFEIIISFIISANNHIPRIRSIIERICQQYGEPFDAAFGQAYSFPAPDALARARVADLRIDCGLGYRDEYIQSTARMITRQYDFATWHELPSAELRRRLLQLHGVGEKVADCILLFGYHRLDAFPVDTWIRRAMTEMYFPNQSPGLRAIQAFAAGRFGAYAGIAQQYLFVNQRSGNRPQTSDFRPQAS